jgi:D-aminopeptidase
LRLTVDFQHGGQADIAATIPGVDRVGDRSITYEADDPIVLYRAFLSAVRLAGTADE